MTSAFEQAARDAISTRLSVRTKVGYLRALKVWLQHCSDEGVNPEDPPLTCAASFREKLSTAKYLAKSGRRRTYKTSTVRDYLSALSFIYKRLVGQRPPAAAWNPFNPEVLARPPSSKVGRTEELPAEEADSMIDAAVEAGAVRDAALMQLLYSTGARRMSILTMRRDGMREREDTLVARIVTKGSGGADLDELVLPRKSTERLRAWLEVAPQSPWVFPGRDRAKHLDMSMANKIVAKWAAATSVEHAHPHRFRVSFITAAFDAKLPWRDIQASVHHADPRSTQRYDRGTRGGGVADVVEKTRTKREE